MKLYSENYGIGLSRYVVNFTDGARHRDGSPFYGIRIFKNRRVKDRFVRELKRDGYSERKD